MVVGRSRSFVLVFVVFMVIELSASKAKRISYSSYFAVRVTGKAKSKTMDLAVPLQTRPFNIEIPPYLWSTSGSDMTPGSESVLCMGAVEDTASVPGPTSGWASLKAS